MAEITWSAFALEDRAAIFAFVSKEDAAAAVRLDERIERAVERLRDFPESGRPGRVEGTREVTVERTPYLIPYMVIGDRVRILRVLHGRQRWPASA